MFNSRICGEKLITHDAVQKVPPISVETSKTYQKS